MGRSNGTKRSKAFPSTVITTNARAFAAEAHKAEDCPRGYDRLRVGRCLFAALVGNAGAGFA